jgi:hypothetical protein
MSGAAQKSKRERRTRLPDGLLKRPADDADLGCEDLGDGPFHTVRVGEAVVAEAALDLDAGTSHEGGEVWHPIALEGGDLVPGVIKRL